MPVLLTVVNCLCTTIETTRLAHKECQLIRKPKRGESQILYDADSAPRLIETVLDNGWMVIQHLEMQDGRRVVGEIRVCPAPPKSPIRDGRNPGDRPTDGVVPLGGITARLLKTIPVGRPEALLDDYRDWIAKFFGPEALGRFDKHNAQPNRTRRRAPKSQRASDRYYAELARDYVLFAHQKSRKPIDQLAVLRGVPPKRIRSHVHLARANGFLTQTGRGKVGGELTAKARRLLDLKA